MNFNETFFIIEGLAYKRGVYFFDDIMPKDRVKRLYKGCLEAYGFKWMESHFIDWVICIAGREQRKNPAYQVPTCNDNCKYYLEYEKLSSQITAFRIEPMETSGRCGWNLMPGRIGGHPDDYYPCCRDRQNKISRRIW